jgi:hypothetical protein
MTATASCFQSTRRARIAAVPHASARLEAKSFLACFAGARVRRVTLPGCSQTFGAVLELLQNAMKGGHEAKPRDAKAAVVAPPALKSSRYACACAGPHPSAPAVFYSYFYSVRLLLHVHTPDTKKCKSSGFGRNVWAPAMSTSWASTQMPRSWPTPCSRCLPCPPPLLRLLRRQPLLPLPSRPKPRRRLLRQAGWRPRRRRAGRRSSSFPRGALTLCSPLFCSTSARLFLFGAARLTRHHRWLLTPQAWVASAAQHVQLTAVL